MAQTVKMKRSSVAGKVPTTTDLALGELAVNTNDGKLFLKQDTGVASIVWVGGKRVVPYADGTSVSINADSTDIAVHNNTQSAGTLSINAPSGTPVDGQQVLLRIRSTNAQTLSWNAAFAGSTDLSLPTASSGSSKWDYFGFIYNSTAAKWHLIASMAGF